MSDLSPLSGVKRKSHFRDARSVVDPERTSGSCMQADAVRPVSRSIEQPFRCVEAFSQGVRASAQNH